MALETGDKAPAFNLPSNGDNDGDGKIALKDLKGKNVVLYFYPKDMTPGCTTEAQDFRDSLKAFEAANTVILGASKDSVARHDKFVAKQELPFHLLSDEEGTLCDAYGVWILKKLYGREYMGIERATFLIDAKGVIRNIWHKVKVKNHVADVLEAARGL